MGLLLLLSLVAIEHSMQVFHTHVLIVTSVDIKDFADVDVCFLFMPFSLLKDTVLGILTTLVPLKCPDIS